MNTLFIDTHSNIMTIAILKKEKTFELKKENMRSHSEYAVNTLKKILNDAQIELKDIDQIIVVNGPGSFTGVRIGVTIAKTIAFSLNIPIKTITSLEAYGVSDSNPYDIVTIEDSKGKYIAQKEGKQFKKFEYRKESEFKEFIDSNNVVISQNRTYDYKKIIEYLSSRENLNPHLVNPIYIKGIDALK